MKSVYLIELDIDKSEDLKEILTEFDSEVKVRALASNTLEEYDHRLDMDFYLGA